MIFFSNNWKNIDFFFVPGIILGIQNQFFDIEHSNFYEFYNFVFDLKIDVLIEKSISRFKKTWTNIEKHEKTGEN